MRVLVAGGSRVLGTASIPLLRAAGYTVDAPSRTQLDLFVPRAVAAAVADKDAILHLATRIPPPERLADPEAWRDTDRLRAEATPILVDAALAASVEWFLFPSIAFVYPENGRVDESSPVAETVPEILLSALEAERHVARLDGDGRRGVVLAFGRALRADLRKGDAHRSLGPLRGHAEDRGCRPRDRGSTVAPGRRGGFPTSSATASGLKRALQGHRRLAARVLTPRLGAAPSARRRPALPPPREPRRARPRAPAPRRRPPP